MAIAPEDEQASAKKQWKAQEGRGDGEHHLQAEKALTNTVPWFWPLQKCSCKGTEISPLPSPPYILLYQQ